MRPLVLALSALFALALLSPPARADWQYTKWGMTLEEVLAAAGGRVYRLTEPKRDGEEVIMAEGVHVAGDLRFMAQFSFLDGKLNRVTLQYQTRDKQNCEDVSNALRARYGPPDQSEAFRLQRTMGWLNRDGNAGILFRQITFVLCWVDYRASLGPTDRDRARGQGL